MKIAISGSTGFVGSKVRLMFQLLGHDVLPLGREVFDLEAPGLAEKLEGSSVIIHLAGAPIMRRWTKKYRQTIYDSRVQTTTRLTEAISQMAQKPEVFICASAVGIYPESGAHDEQSDAVADTFLGEVCRDWEAAATKAQFACQTIMFRFGVILGDDGGALKQMLPPFKAGIGGPIGHGRQMMSWVHIEDVLGAFQFALKKPELSGPVNITSPHPVTNKAFTKKLASTLRRPAIIPIPPLALKVMYGKAAETLTHGQTALPGKLENHGFFFRFPKLEEAFGDLLSKH